jgi:hypothetical protein
MHAKSLAVVVALAALLGAPARAVPLSYEGILASGVPVTGFVSGSGWANEVASEVDFWQFFGTAGQIVDIQATRLDFNLDPAFSMYFGTTSADEAQFINDADWGGLVFLNFADDEISNPGPGGDPLLSSLDLPFTGAYTIAVGGFLSTGEGPFAYQLGFAGAAATVPAPGTAMLLAGGLAGLIWYRRKYFG